MCVCAWWSRESHLSIPVCVCVNVSVPSLAPQVHKYTQQAHARAPAMCITFALARPRVAYHNRATCESASSRVSYELQPVPAAETYTMVYTRDASTLIHICANWALWTRPPGDILNADTFFRRLHAAAEGIGRGGGGGVGGAEEGGGEAHRLRAATAFVVVVVVVAASDGKWRYILLKY